MGQEPDTICVLLVDDETDVLIGLSRALAGRGFHVSTASDADDALELAERHAFDVAVVGLHAPGRAPMEALRGLKERHPATEVLVLTTHPSSPQTLEAMLLGAFDFLIRPIDVTALARRIRDANEHRRCRSTRTA